MKTKDFFYNLPPELIAQTPIEHRDHSRLLTLDKETGALHDRRFYDIVDLLHAGDVLVLNDSRVLPARLFGCRPDKDEQIEMLLLEERRSKEWVTLARPGRKTKVGAELVFGNGELTAIITGILDDGCRVAQFACDGDMYAILDQIGQIPLPHYIHEALDENERYQTVYANERGSAAAPTAGLHFTTELLGRIRAKGVEVVNVTLHVGLGTFRPVKVNDITQHKMHEEHFFVPALTAEVVTNAKAEGRRIVAVGTTSCRTLESVTTDGVVQAGGGYTSIFIYPGYEWKAVDALITNFHLPESTLIMLVSALAGHDNIMAAYEHAVAERYRFFSFGDAMLIE